MLESGKIQRAAGVDHPFVKSRKLDFVATDCHPPNRTVQYDSHRPPVTPACNDHHKFIEGRKRPENNSSRRDQNHVLFRLCKNNWHEHDQDRKKWKVKCLSLTEAGDRTVSAIA